MLCISFECKLNLQFNWTYIMTGQRSFEVKYSQKWSKNSLFWPNAYKMHIRCISNECKLNFKFNWVYIMMGQRSFEVKYSQKWSKYGQLGLKMRFLGQIHIKCISIKCKLNFECYLTYIMTGQRSFEVK